MDDPSTVSMQCSRSLTGFESFATASYMLFFRSRTCSPPAQTVAKVAVFQLRLMNLKESPPRPTDLTLWTRACVYSGDVSICRSGCSKLNAVSTRS